ncbi:MAG TPA: MarR family transcriptional regulator [Candidatus Agrococcus pullicola]|uniref:MarR family transcriptional regulator n=1 Tax=Candidatus Agrococcus pullicola TaxID=2838429 RepID=A0A9D2C9A3_9MICO|nr:MarR family transcriptional regulator [Candidatus Agrococcus pullicola]
MTEAAAQTERKRALIHQEHLGPSRETITEEGFDEATVQETIELLRALHAWHVAAEEHSAASQRGMRLGSTDMRAIRYLMACKREGVIVTSGMLAEHLAITGPSVTKMLDRLEQYGHVRRMPHPRDRRAVSVEVTEQTSERARNTIGSDHARRFEVIARLSSGERQAATKLLRKLSALPVIEHEPEH